MTTKTGIRRCQPGFEHIFRFLHRDGTTVANIRPGEFYVSSDPERLVTVLGSCVAACIHDPRTRVGGMNHFLLPEGQGSTGAASLTARYGSFAMEALINAVLKLGGSRRNLEVKLFGGAHVVQGLSDVGERNIEFVESYLEEEGIPVVSADLGGNRARLIHYSPNDGKVRVKRLSATQEVIEGETRYRDRISTTKGGGSVELF